MNRTRPAVGLNGRILRQLISMGLGSLLSCSVAAAPEVNIEIPDAQVWFNPADVSHARSDRELDTGPSKPAQPASGLTLKEVLALDTPRNQDFNQIWAAHHNGSGRYYEGGRAAGKVLRAGLRKLWDTHSGIKLKLMNESFDTREKGMEYDVDLSSDEVEFTVQYDF